MVRSVELQVYALLIFFATKLHPLFWWCLVTNY